MEIGKIKKTEITKEMERSYLDYAMSVIVSRALPDVRDGLKPVQRRILYAMYKMGLGPSAKRTKSAKVVGETMGKYHPHGDAAIYDALVRMAQDFSLRYPLVSGQGNFGSVDGDPPAAMRYTEVRLAPISLELLSDIQKNTVEFTDNFDATLKEPVFLPAKLPNLLLMGAEGIAVGMATKIPPHNLKEVVRALVYMIEKGAVEKGKFQSPVTVDQLLRFIRGPDFPTGGEIYNPEELKNAYATGRGKITVRGKAEIKIEGKKTIIVISEIPYQVNKASLIAKIATLCKEKKIRGISALRDESDRRGIRIVVEVKRGGRANVILNNLFKYTELSTTFPCNFVVLVDRVPQTLNLKQILLHYIWHREEVIRKRSQFELEEAKRKAHILEGLKIALKFLDKVIETIKKSKNEKEAKENLIRKFNLTAIQAQAILDMPLKKLSRLEREKIEDEYQMLQQTIVYLEDLLAHPEKILQVIKEELLYLEKKYGDERRTKIVARKLEDFKEEELIPKEEVLVIITKDGYIKRLPPSTYRSQRRGGKGVLGMTTKEKDKVDQIISTSTHDFLLIFTNRGKVYSLKVYDLPEGTRKSKGKAIVNLVDLEEGEKIKAVLPIKNFAQEGFILLATEKGIVKKTRISDFKNIRSSGIIALKLKKDDQLAWAKKTEGKNEVMIITKEGKGIRFKEEDIRPMGRTAEGVRGIKLKGEDKVVVVGVVPQKEEVKDRRRKTFCDILLVSEKGLGKRTKIELFPLQKRGGVGVKAAKLTSKTGKIAAGKIVTEKDNYVIITSSLGQVIKLPLKNIPQLGRNTQGVILMRFTNPEDKVAAITTI